MTCDVQPLDTRPTTPSLEPWSSSLAISTAALTRTTMHLGIDLDGVVTQTQRVMNAFLANYLGVEPMPVDCWDWYRAYGERADEAWEAMWVSFRRKGTFETLLPYEDAAETVLALDEQGHDITFITYRPTDSVDDTRRWLDKYGLHFPVIYTSRKWEVGCDFYIDDHVETVLALRKRGARAYLMGREWNTYAWGDIPTLVTWREVWNTIQDLSK